jgi:membrane-associated phospholipid phosphatase
MIDHGHVHHHHHERGARANVLNVMVNVIVIVIVIGSLRPPLAHAEEPRELRYDLRVDLPLGVAALAITSLPLFMHGPRVCRWCDDNGFDAGARRSFLWSNPRAAYHSSNAFAVAMPLLALGVLGLEAAQGGTLQTYAADGLFVGEAVLSALALNQIIKFAVARQRPFVHYQNESVLAQAPRRTEDNVSFYSAHTGLAFSLVAATATIAQLRGYKSAPYIWGLGLPLAAATGFFRIAADRHYLSDVLVGALISTAVGIALPRLLHGRRTTDTSSASTSSLSSASP